MAGGVAPPELYPVTGIAFAKTDENAHFQVSINNPLPVTGAGFTGTLHVLFPPLIGPGPFHSVVQINDVAQQVIPTGYLYRSWTIYNWDPDNFIYLGNSLVVAGSAVNANGSGWPIPPGCGWTFDYTDNAAELLWYAICDSGKTANAAIGLLK